MRSNLVPLSRRDRVLLVLFALAVIGFGIVVEKRSAFSSRRMGDLGCFLRAGWAVRTGHDIYDVIDDNDWHYNYPPAFAIAVAPLGDPPPGQDAAGFLPYPISVAIFYIGGVLLLFAGVHRLASALEETSTDPTFRAQTPAHRRWWALRVVPILVCLVPIGTTLGKGQVNTLILFLLASTGADWLRGKSFRGGLTLAAAIVIKVIPIYLLVLPMKNRDGRALAGCALGLFLGLVALPLCVWSPAETLNVYAKYGQVFVGPLLHLGDDSSRTDELLGTNGTDSVSLKTALHHWTYPDWDFIGRQRTAGGSGRHLRPARRASVTAGDDPVAPAARGVDAGAAVVRSAGVDDDLRADHPSALRDVLRAARDAVPGPGLERRAIDRPGHGAGLRSGAGDDDRADRDRLVFAPRLLPGSRRTGRSDVRRTVAAAGSAA